MAVMRKKKKKKAGRKPSSFAHPVIAGVAGSIGGLMLETHLEQGRDKRGRKLYKREEKAGKKLVAKNIEKRRKKDIARLSKKSWEDPSKGYGERAYKIADNLRKSRKKKKK